MFLIMLFSLVCVNLILLLLNFLVFNENFFLNFLLNLVLYLFLRFVKVVFIRFFFLVEEFLDLNINFMLKGSLRIYCWINRFIGNLCLFWLCLVMWFVKVSSCIFLLFFIFFLCMFCIIIFLIECMCGVCVIKNDDNKILEGCGKYSLKELSLGV